MCMHVCVCMCMNVCVCVFVRACVCVSCLFPFMKYVFCKFFSLFSLDSGLLSWFSLFFSVYFQYTGNGQPDMTAQYNLYFAALQQVYPLSWFAGMYWWSWDTSQFDGGICDDGYDPCRKPAAQLVSLVYSHPTLDALVPNEESGVAIGSTQVIYSNGQLASTWQSWSYAGTFNPTDSYEPMPGHSASFSSTNVSPGCAGAFSLFSTNTITVSSTSTLSFNVRSSEPATDISVFICPTSDCSSATPQLNINQFLPAANNCSLPSAASWANSQAVIPFAALNFGNVPFVRFSVCNANSNGQTATWYLDNIQINF
eukprot:m.402768 g.402768  ORF g.402768 m.402768 type:complete len:312 (+) comp56453_c0_seq6:60-995(+)